MAKKQIFSQANCGKVKSSAVSTTVGLVCGALGETLEPVLPSLNIGGVLEDQNEVTAALRSHNGDVNVTCSVTPLQQRYHEPPCSTILESQNIHCATSIVCLNDVACPADLFFHSPFLSGS